MNSVVTESKVGCLWNILWSLLDDAGRHDVIDVLLDTSFFDLVAILVNFGQGDF